MVKCSLHIFCLTSAIIMNHPFTQSLIFQVVVVVQRIIKWEQENINGRKSLIWVSQGVCIQASELWQQKPRDHHIRPSYHEILCAISHGLSLERISKHFPINLFHSLISWYLGTISAVSPSVINSIHIHVPHFRLKGRQLLQKVLVFRQICPLKSILKQPDRHFWFRLVIVLVFCALFQVFCFLFLHRVL